MIAKILNHPASLIVAIVFFAWAGVGGGQLLTGGH